MQRTYVKIFLGLLIVFSLSRLNVSAFNQQGFKTYQEGYNNALTFSCEQQCVVILGPLGASDYLKLNGPIQGNGTIGYGFLVGQQIAPGEMINVNGTTTLDSTLSFLKNPYYSQIPKEAQVALLIQGNVQANGLSANIGSLGTFESLANGFNEALQYREYNPRTINFLEGPTRNGKYINEYFFWWIIGFLAFAIIRYFASTEKKNKQKAVRFGVGVLVFFRVFFDFFSTVNQVKMYKQVTSATNIMENGRVGRSSDFYPFLDFIKTKVPKGEKGFFVAPYPFFFEGKYHIYPDVKFDVITGAQYLFVYNPYGTQNPFNFVDPVYSGGVVSWNNMTFPVQEEIIRKPYAKIYRLLPK